MLQISLKRYLTQSWLELPFLVDQFVLGVAPALKTSTQDLREAVSEMLDLNDYENLARVCRMIAEINDLLFNVYNDADVKYDHGNEYQQGLAAAVIKAWYTNDEMVGAIEEVFPSDIEPMRVLPWKAWAAWGRI